MSPGNTKTPPSLSLRPNQRIGCRHLSILEPRFRALDSSIGFRLEESGATGPQSSRWVGADPLDGTNHFAAGGTAYSVQAHYVETEFPSPASCSSRKYTCRFPNPPIAPGRLAYGHPGRRRVRSPNRIHRHGLRPRRCPAGHETAARRGQTLRLLRAAQHQDGARGVEAGRARAGGKRHFVAVTTGVGGAAGT